MTETHKMNTGTILADATGLYLAEKGEAFDSTHYFILPCFYNDDCAIVARTNDGNVIYTKYKRNGKKLSNVTLLEEAEYRKAIS